MSTFSRFISFTAAVGIAFSASALPANASAAPSWTSQFTNQSLTVSVASGELTYSVNTAHTSLTLQTGNNTPASGLLSVSSGFSTYACNETKTESLSSLSSGTPPSGCVAVFTNVGLTGLSATNASSQTISGSQLTQSRVMTASETNVLLNSGYTHIVAYISMVGAGPATWYVPFSGRVDGTSEGPSVDSDVNPGVAYSGPLISKLIRVAEGGSGSLTLHGKRLVTVSEATIGGKVAELETTTKHGKLIKVSFSDLQPGKYDLVLKTKNFGSITIRDAVVVQ